MSISTTYIPVRPEEILSPRSDRHFAHPVKVPQRALNVPGASAVLRQVSDTCRALLARRLLLGSVLITRPKRRPTAAGDRAEGARVDRRLFRQEPRWAQFQETGTLEVPQRKPAGWGTGGLSGFHSTGMGEWESWTVPVPRVWNGLGFSRWLLPSSRPAVRAGSGVGCLL